MLGDSGESAAVVAMAFAQKVAAEAGTGLRPPHSLESTRSGILLVPDVLAVSVCEGGVFRKVARVDE